MSMKRNIVIDGQEVAFRASIGCGFNGISLRT